MQDRPTAQELIAAVAQFLGDELVPSLGDARLRFRALIATNVLAIVGRELEAAEPLAREQWQRLAALLERPAGERPAHPRVLAEDILAMSRELCQAIRAGRADDGPAYEAVLEHARQTLIEKLSISNPRFVAALARENESHQPSKEPQLWNLP
jgi:hypothetical protein